MPRAVPRATSLVSRSRHPGVLSPTEPESYRNCTPSSLDGAALLYINHSMDNEEGVRYMQRAPQAQGCPCLPYGRTGCMPVSTILYWPKVRSNGLDSADSSSASGGSPRPTWPPVIGCGFRQTTAFSTIQNFHGNVTLGKVSSLQRVNTPTTAFWTQYTTQARLVSSVGSGTCNIQEVYPLGCMQGHCTHGIPSTDHTVVPTIGQYAGHQLSLTDMCVSRADSKYSCSYT